jgi:hypothetical protein
VLWAPFDLDLLRCRHVNNHKYALQKLILVFAIIKIDKTIIINIDKEIIKLSKSKNSHFLLE